MGDLIGFVVVEPDGLSDFAGFNIMLGTPLFMPDDRASADACLEGDAFVAEVRRSPSWTDEEIALASIYGVCSECGAPRRSWPDAGRMTIVCSREPLKHVAAIALQGGLAEEGDTRHGG